SSSSQNRRDVPRRLRQDRDELYAVKLFPIAYGNAEGVDVEVMQDFADITQTRLISGDTTDIRKIYQEMSSYF
ncbi:MAG: hypothetical protein ABIO92_10730, partial [Chloroflexia bacterium]